MMRRPDEIRDRIGGLFNGDFHGHRREILSWSYNVISTSRTFALAYAVIYNGAKMCVGEGIHRALKHEDWFAREVNAKLTEYLWLVNPGHELLSDWHSTSISQFGMPKLLEAARIMSLDLVELGIEETTELIRMSKGKPCHPRCLSGCVH